MYKVSLLNFKRTWAFVTIAFKQIKNKSIFLEEIKKIGVKKIEYLKTFNVFTLKETNTLSSYSKIFIAYYLNGVRLIDNL